MALRDAVQKVAAGQRFYGYRRVAAALHNQGSEVGVKRVRRIMKEDKFVRNRVWCTTRIEGVNMPVPIMSDGWKKWERSSA